MTFSDFLSPDSFSASVRLNTIADAVESLSATKYLFVRAECRRRGTSVSCGRSGAKAKARAARGAEGGRRWSTESEASRHVR